MSRISVFLRWSLALLATLAASAASAQECFAPADNLRFIGQAGSVTVDYDPAFTPNPGTRSATFSSPPAATDCYSSTTTATGITLNQYVGKFPPEEGASTSASSVVAAALPDALGLSWFPIDNNGGIKRIAIDMTVTISLDRTMKLVNYFNGTDLFLAIQTPPSFTAPVKVGTTAIQLNDVFAAGTYLVKLSADHTFTAIQNQFYAGSLNMAFEPSDEVPNITPPPPIGPVSAAQSTVSASTASVSANGTATSTITVTLKDANGNLISGKTVTLGQGSGVSTITPASGTSDSNGVATFTVKSTKAEAVTYAATGDGVAITQTAQVTYTAVAAAGACGPAANSVSNASAPTSGLCAAGSTASLVRSFTGGYSWSCRGELNGPAALCAAWSTAAPQFSPSGTKFELVDNAAQCNVERVALIPAPAGGPTAGGPWTMPYGALDFELTSCVGDTVTVKLTFPETIASGVAWKYGPKDVVNAPNVLEWYQLPGAIFDRSITLTIRDNGLGDSDPRRGVIVDPVGPAFLSGAAPGVTPTVEQIPTLSEWAMMLLAAFLGLFAASRLRQRPA